MTTAGKRQILRGRGRRYACAICGRHDVAEAMLYSRWTRRRYCPDVDACERRARRR